MARPKGKFSLYKRSTVKGKFIYYAKIPNADPTQPALKISTGQSSKVAAALWAQNYIERLANEEKLKEEERLNITFKDYAVDFWAHEGLYAVGRRARRRTISYGFLDSRKGVTENHLIPYWGDMRLRDITPKKIDRWVINMASDNRIAPGTINQRLQILRVMLEEACAREYLTENPAQFVKPVSNHYRPKGVLSLDEVRSLLNPRIWQDYRQYAIGLLTLGTGIRISEVRGLQVAQVHLTFVEIHTAWEEKYGLKEPKCGSIRDIPITAKIYDTLQTVIESTGTTELVFHGPTHNKPISKSWIERSFYKALNQIGIDEVTRIQRNITFHSLRHTTNTILRSAGIPDAKVRMITGHRDESMTERYTHFRVENYEEICKIQERMML